MTRVKGSAVTKARHKKVLKAAKGYFGSKHRLYKTAKEQLMHSGQYAYRDRKQKKRDFRKLWITRINAACRENGINYSRFIEGLTKAGVDVNRKMLSEIAINDPAAFTKLVEIAKAGKAGEIVREEQAVENEIIANDKKEAVKEVKETVKETPKKEETPKEVKETAKDEETDYSKLTVVELKALASERKILGASKMKKAELIEALEK